MQKETVYEAVGKEEAMQKEAMPEETVRGEAALPVPASSPC